MLDVSMAQLERGHLVTVITKACPGDSRYDETLPFQVLRIRAERNLVFGYKASSKLKDLPYHPDLVHTHGPAALPGIYWKKKLSIPLIHTLHVLRKYQFHLYAQLPSIIDDYEKRHNCRVIRKPKFYHKFSPYAFREVALEKIICRHADHILLVASYFSDLVHKYYGVSKKHLTTIYNGSNFAVENQGDVDTIFKEYQLSTDNKIILFVGRTEWTKQVHLLVEAMPKVLETVPESRLLIAGSGDQDQDIAALIRKLNLSDSVRQLGWISHEKLSFLLKNASCFCLPSLSEGLSKALLEALGMDVPIIASNILSNREVLYNGKWGVLIGESDAKSWGKAIIGSIQKKNNNKENVSKVTSLLDKKYRWRHVADRIDTAYRKVLNV